MDVADLEGESVNVDSCNDVKVVRAGDNLGVTNVTSRVNALLGRI